MGIIPQIENAPMSSYTSFRTGGPADLLLLPRDRKELFEALSTHPDALVIGGGTNLLISDSGIRGAVIRLFEPLSSIEFCDDLVCADAGARLSSVCTFAHKNGRIGMEFAGGIPGTVGGGVLMNAGAYGGEIKDVLYDCEVLSRSGDLKTYAKSELDLSYRHSQLMQTGDIVLRARFALPAGDVVSAEKYLKELNARRRDKQPLEFPSAGSTFKRPEGYFAGALIEQSGLKGFCIGGAQVSEKHAGFVINKGGASSYDIYRLIRHIQDKVKADSGVTLEPEVRIIGTFED